MSSRQANDSSAYNANIRSDHHQSDSKKKGLWAEEKYENQKLKSQDFFRHPEIAVLASLETSPLPFLVMVFPFESTITSAGMPRTSNFFFKLFAASEPCGSVYHFIPYLSMYLSWSLDERSEETKTTSKSFLLLFRKSTKVGVK